MTEDIQTQKLEAALFEFHKRHRLGLPDPNRDGLWSILETIDLSSQEYKDILTAVIEQTEEKEGLPAACLSARDIFHHVPSEKTNTANFFKEKLNTLIDRLLHQDEANAIEQLLIMVEYDNTGVKEFGINKILNHVQTFLNSDKDQAAEILQKTYDAETEKKLDQTTEDRRTILVYRLVSPDYAKANSVAAFKLLKSAYQRTPKGSRAQGYLIKSLLPLMDDKKIPVEDRFKTAADMICALDNGMDSGSELAIGVETKFKELAKLMLAKDPFQTLALSIKKANDRDNVRFNEGSLCKRTIGKTLLDAGKAAFDQDKKNPRKVLSILETAYRHDHLKTEIGFYNKVAEQILSLREKSPTISAKKELVCLKWIFFNITANNDLFEKVVGVLEKCIDSAPPEDTKTLLQEIWELAPLDHTLVFKEEAADKLYIKAVQEFAKKNNPPQTPSDMLELEYMLKRIPFMNTYTHEPRQAVVAYFRNKLQQSYKDNPDSTIALINNLFEAQGSRIARQWAFPYTQTLLINLFETIDIDEEKLHPTVQEGLYPQKPQPSRLSVREFIKKAKH